MPKLVLNSVEGNISVTVGQYITVEMGGWAAYGSDVDTIDWGDGREPDVYVGISDYVYLEPGTFTITVTKGPITDTQTVVVTGGAWTGLRIDASPYPLEAGVATTFSVTTQANDPMPENFDDGILDPYMDIFIMPAGVRYDGTNGLDAIAFYSGSIGDSVHDEWVNGVYQGSFPGSVESIEYTFADDGTYYPYFHVYWTNVFSWMLTPDGLPYLNIGSGVSGEITVGGGHSGGEDFGTEPGITVTPPGGGEEPAAPVVDFTWRQASTGNSTTVIPEYLYVPGVDMQRMLVARAGFSADSVYIEQTWKAVGHLYVPYSGGEAIRIIFNLTMDEGETISYRLQRGNTVSDTFTLTGGTTHERAIHWLHGIPLSTSGEIITLESQVTAGRATMFILAAVMLPKSLLMDATTGGVDHAL